jgi:hypothetical protein
MIEDATQNSPAAGARLFSDGQIVFATFLGAPLAGCLLLASNYRKLADHDHARASVLWGVAATAALLIISFFLPENFPGAALPIGYCVGMRQIALRLQGRAIAHHLAAGGLKGSWGVTVASGLGCLALLLVLTFGTLMILNVW